MQYALRQIVFLAASVSLIETILPRSGHADYPFAAPARIRIKMPKGKVGLQTMTEVADYGFCYLYDGEHSAAEEWRHFVLAKRNQRIYGRANKVLWKMTVAVKDGEHIPFLGEIYRCDTTKSQLVKLENNGLRNGDWEHRIGVLHGLELKLEETPKSSFQLDLEGFDLSPGGEAKDRVKLNLYAGPEQTITLPGAPPGAGPHTVLLQAGDRVESTYFELILERIVRPDKELKIQGWAEFTVKDKGVGVK